MQTNLIGGLVIGFYGTTAINGVPARQMGSIDDTLRKPGFISNNNTEGNAIFGVMMSIHNAANAAEFYVGLPSGYAYVGPLLNEQAVRENDPAKPNWKMNGTPATAVTIGTLLYNSWTTLGGNSIAPVIGCRVIANNTTGFIEFTAAGNTVVSGFTQINAQVIDVDTFTGTVTIHFGQPSNT